MQLWHFLICDIVQQKQTGKSCPVRLEGPSTQPGLLGGDGICREKYEKRPNTEKSPRLQWEIWEAKYFLLHLKDS